MVLSAVRGGRDAPDAFTDRIRVQYERQGPFWRVPDVSP